LARDAVQEALVSAWRDLPRLRDPDRFDAWLYRLTVRTAVKGAKRKRRQAIQVDVAEIEFSTGDFAVDVAERDQVDRALRQLEPDRRALVVLHFYLGLSVPEVARALGIPEGTAKSRLARALAVLRVAVDAAGPVRTAVAKEEGQPA
jgi:RNA polymerase sigma-70 factor (ECF subfamily)